LWDIHIVGELLLSAKAFLPGFLLFVGGQNGNILLSYN